MGLRVTSSNPFAAQRNILLQQARLQKYLEQLSSGLRLNSAADDPAGFAISEQLGAQIAEANALSVNTSRDINLVQTAEGALAEINTQLDAIRGLAVQAGNAAILGDTGLQAIQEQINRATESINRIVETTEFAGQPLLDGTFREKDFLVAEGNPTQLTIPDVAANALGAGVENASGFASLSEIDVTTPQGAADALRIVDAAINEVSGIRTALGAFQTNTLEATSRSLGVTGANLITSRSTIRDTDFAAATGESALSRIRLQAGVFAQAMANQRTGMILDLLA
ncbi:flagellin FliC [Candidatus Poribacteria bacterium]|nr:flagellin FliC [Candidatus Poribacteria bacterium]